MQTRYTRSLRYDCQRHALDHVGPPCQSLAGAALEGLVRDQVLEVITPAGLELSRRAAQECRRDRVALDRQWRLRLERAAQEADRACRQYNAVEPENRLVARTLEQRWEEALRAERQLQDDHDRFLREQPAQLSAEELTALKKSIATLEPVFRA